MLGLNLIHISKRGTRGMISLSFTQLYRQGPLECVTVFGVEWGGLSAYSSQKCDIFPQMGIDGPMYKWIHYDDVIMSEIASQITSLTIVYSTVLSGADQSKHQSSASLAFVWEIHRWPVNFPHKWPVTRKIFPFDDVIMPWPMDIRLVILAIIEYAATFMHAVCFYPVLLRLGNGWWFKRSQFTNVIFPPYISWLHQWHRNSDYSLSTYICHTNSGIVDKSQ